MMTLLPLILIGVCCNVLAQVFLKMGIPKMQWHLWDSGRWPAFLFDALTTPAIASGVFVYIASFVLWIGVLSKADVSLAYPMTSLGYLLTAIAGFFVFHEPVSFQRLIGILVIICGVFIVARTA